MKRRLSPFIALLCVQACTDGASAPTPPGAGGGVQTPSGGSVAGASLGGTAVTMGGSGGASGGGASGGGAGGFLSGAPSAGTPAASGAGGSGGAGGSAGSGGAGGGAVGCAVEPQRIYDDVAYFASDGCRGRIPGDQGNSLALDHAQQAFEAAGLAPGGDQGTYRQAFDFTCSADWCENHRSGKAENVLGKLEGSDPVLKQDVIVVGAHIDHLGFKGNDIYRGADDNASGAAIVLELARMFGRCGLKPKRTLLFAEWNSEEMGLVGSRYYVAHPKLPLADTIAVYNFDMVGSGDGTGVLLFGGNDQKNRWLTDLMTSASKAAGLKHVIQIVPQKLASDHAPFVEKGIPICWGFSRPDPHPGYHSPADDMSKIRVQSLRAVSELFWSALKPLAMGEEGTFGVQVP